VHPSIRPLFLAGAVFVGAVAIVACDSATHAQTACAKSAGASKSGASKSGSTGSSKSSPSPAPRGPVGGSASASSATGGRPDSTAKATGGVDRSKSPDPPAYPAGGGAPRTETSPTAPRTRDNTTRDRARAASRRLNTRLDIEDYADARTLAPTRVTRTGLYRSPVTDIEYRYHDLGWYRRPGLVIDLYDPYDPFNYWYRPLSPFNGLPYVVAGGCDGSDEHVEQPVNVNVVVNNDGQIIGEATPSTTPGTVPDSTTTTGAPT
jgi:hypothetical protein